MLAQKIQTLANHPKERIQHSKHGGSLKSVIFILLLIIKITIIIIIIIYHHFPSEKARVQQLTFGTSRETQAREFLTNWTQSKYTAYLTLSFIFPKLKELLGQILWEGFI